MFRMLSLLYILVITCVITHQAERNITVVHAFVGENATLPCKVDADHCGTLHSVKWYRDTSRIYVYSQSGQIARAEGDAINRMSVGNDENGNHTLLKISPVFIEDEAIYKCEITYLEVRENCVVEQIISLSTFVVPASVRVVDDEGVVYTNSTNLPPKNEGSQLELICEARNGKPIPSVKWYKGGSLFENVTHKIIDDGNGVGTAIAKLFMNLKREDIKQELECTIESNAMDDLLRVRLTVDVDVRPSGMRAFFPTDYISQGKNVILQCNIFGAKPPATVVWFNGSQIVSPEYVTFTHLKEETGTFTTSAKLEFTASRWENGNTFSCEAENEVMRSSQEKPLQQNASIEVRFPPVVKLTALKTVVNETDDVFFSCTYYANPSKLLEVTWQKNGKELEMVENKHYLEITEILSLNIRNVSRLDIGNYNCLLRNEVGEEASLESVYLDVYYPPVVEVIFEPHFPLRSIDRNNVTMECKVIYGNPLELRKVKWFFEDEILVELPKCNSSVPDIEINRSAGGPFCDVDPSVLSLIEVDSRFGGKYSCQGENQAGSGSSSTQKELIVYTPPGPVSVRYYPAIVIKNQIMTLECIAHDLGKPANVTYMWFRGEKPLHNTTSSNWTMQALLDTRNNFTCLAMNAGGPSETSTIAVMVWAPPTLISKVIPYKGVLYNTADFSLTCRIECFPLCSVRWFKDKQLLNTTNNPLYSTYERQLPPDSNKNDFESIESTLIWNLKNWPNGQLDRDSAPALYTCKSESHFGPEAYFTTEIAVDYPPENLTVSQRIVTVVENEIPEAVNCSGKGRPKLSYLWKKNATSRPIVKDSVLKLPKMTRSDGGQFTCEAFNKYGNKAVNVYFDILYKPDCSVEMGNRFGHRVLICTARGNPSDVTFIWRIRQSNASLANTVINEGAISYIILDTTSDTDALNDVTRTYQCIANNSVGESQPCERFAPVSDDASWLSNEGNLAITAAAFAALMAFMIMVSIVVFLLCRKKKHPSKLENLLCKNDREVKVLGSHVVASTNGDRGYEEIYENVPFQQVYEKPCKPYQPQQVDLDYADLDYQYGPMNYKAASIYAAVKRRRPKNMNEANGSDSDLL